MPLRYDDVPGSWGQQSEGWPETPFTFGKQLLCSKAAVVPYGSYVVMRPNYPSYDGAVIRVATEEQKRLLEDAHEQMFVICGDLLIDELKPAIERARQMGKL